MLNLEEDISVNIDDIFLFAVQPLNFFILLINPPYNQHTEDHLFMGRRPDGNVIKLTHCVFVASF